MLIECTVNRWQGWPNKEKRCILNTRRMSELDDISTLSVTETRLLYSYREGHRRGNLHSIDINRTPAQINTASELTPYDDFIELYVFPDEDPDETPVAKHFKVRDIARVIEDPKDDTRCYVWIHHNEVRLRRYLVNLSMDDLYDYAMTGTTTTSTTTSTTERQ